VKKGFTFLEILMVVMILGIIVAMATPRFRESYIDLQLKSQAKSLAKFLTYAQERAIFDKRIYRFEVSPDKARYWLTREETGGEEGTFNFVQIQGRYGRRFEFPEGISLGFEKESILFYPDGSADVFTLSLKNQEGKELVLKNGTRFGYIQIEEAPET